MINMNYLKLPVVAVVMFFSLPKIIHNILGLVTITLKLVGNLPKIS